MIDRNRNAYRNRNFGRNQNRNRNFPITSPNTDKRKKDSTYTHCLPKNVPFKSQYIITNRKTIKHLQLPIIITPKKVY